MVRYELGAKYKEMASSFMKEKDCDFTYLDL
jgi:hypothetical protein